MQVGPDRWLCSAGEALDDCINHSCDPNAGFATGEPVLYALRDIAELLIRRQAFLRMQAAVAAEAGAREVAAVAERAAVAVRRKIHRRNNKRNNRRTLLRSLLTNLVH